MSNAPLDIMYECIDETLYRYENRCGSSRDQSLCGTDDLCHWSWPQGDSARQKSSDAACRPIPEEWMINSFTFNL
jgi:hypothetical protein